MCRQLTRLRSSSDVVPDIVFVVKNRGRIRNNYASVTRHGILLIMPMVALLGCMR